MAAKKHDVIVIGGGHNGLIVAAYLVKAGVDVCVLESLNKVGGAVITRDLPIPGFKYDVAAHVHATIQANPLIHRDELGLKARYGLKYISPEIPIAVVFPDQRALIFYRDIDKTCQSISQFSQRDSENYRRFYDYTKQLLKVAQIATFSPVPSWGAMMSFLSSSEEGREYIRLIMSSAMDVVEEWFESAELRIALTRYASEVMVGPCDKGTGNVMFFVSLMHSWGMAIPEGGSGKLTEALAAFVTDNGGTIKVSSPVKSIKVLGNKAKAVVLENGEEIEANKAVVSNVNVKQLYLDLLKPDDLPSGFQNKVRLIKFATFSGIVQNIALNESPRFKAGGDVDKAFQVEIVPHSIEEFSRIFDDLRYGIPSTKIPLVMTPTLVDTKKRAPNGKHVLCLYHYEPYSLKDGGPAMWDVKGQEIADAILETTREYTTNMGQENILGRWFTTPAEMERILPAMLHGDLGHIGHFLNQSYANRPLIGWGNYKTPMDNIYMCGASTHPGLGVNGGGRAAVQAIMGELGIDFRKVIAK